jgi:hypothetical protein
MYDYVAMDCDEVLAASTMNQAYGILNLMLAQHGNSTTSQIDGTTQTRKVDGKT